MHVDELMPYVIETNEKCIIGKGIYGISTVPPTVAKIIIGTIYCSTVNQPLPEVFGFTFKACSANPHASTPELHSSMHDL